MFQEQLWAVPKLDEGCLAAHACTIVLSPIDSGSSIGGGGRLSLTSSWTSVLGNGLIPWLCIGGLESSQGSVMSGEVGVGVVCLMLSFGILGKATS